MNSQTPSTSTAARSATAGLRIDRLHKSTFRQHIAERLRAAILAGELAPGAALVETSLATQFNVSRGPLREAMRELIEEGLLVTVPYTGTHVIALSADDIREMYSMRIVLERFAFEQAWDRRDARFPAASCCAATTSCAPPSTPATTAPASRPSSTCMAWSTRPAATGCCSAPGTACAGGCSCTGRRTTVAHATRGPRRDSARQLCPGSTRAYDLDAMLDEITNHMGRGANRTEAFVRFANPFDHPPTHRSLDMSIRPQSRPRRHRPPRSLALAIPSLARAQAGGTLEADQAARQPARGRDAGPALVLQGPQDRRVVAGLGISMGKAMAAALGVKFETVEVTWGTAIAALQGEQDRHHVHDRRHARARAGGGLPRHRPLLYYSLAVLAKDDLPVKTWADLNKDRHAHRRAPGQQHGQVRQRERLPKATIQRFPGNAEAIAAFQAGRADAVCLFHPPLLAARQRLGTGKIVVPTRRSPGVERGAAQGRRQAFVQWVDKSLAAYYKSGQTQKWYEEFLVGFGLDPKAAPPVMKECSEVGLHGACMYRWDFGAGLGQRRPAGRGPGGNTLQVTGTALAFGVPLGLGTGADAAVAAAVAALAGRLRRSRSSAPRRRWCSCSGSSSRCPSWSRSR
jgi:polar amino acid transport system substrate-binding protein